ncbi:hypothetical protein TNCV_1750811 [Trichonephila clavipes]|nr:hypothetical protein TNCV_1750811 [Trichonephila clavipes]
MTASMAALELYGIPLVVKVGFGSVGIFVLFLLFSLTVRIRGIILLTGGWRSQNSVSQTVGEMPNWDATGIHLNHSEITTLGRAVIFIKPEKYTVCIIWIQNLRKTEKKFQSLDKSVVSDFRTRDHEGSSVQLGQLGYWDL